MKNLLVFVGFLLCVHPLFAQEAIINLPGNIKMVLVPDGEFIMGSDGPRHLEMPSHKVKVDGFYIDATEVTQEEFKSLMGRNPAFHNDDPKKPVEQVSWFDAVLFCNARSIRDGLEPAYSYSRIELSREVEGRTRFLFDFAFDPTKTGYRLPTEAQWEYACRAGTSTTYFWGDEIDGDYVWWDRNSNQTTHRVATKKPNAWGLYDTVGNVWEWTNDWFSYYTKEPQDNPTGPEAWGIEKVLRGGSYKQHDNKFEDLVTSSSRGMTYPYAAHPTDGFRCVRPVK